MVNVKVGQKSSKYKERKKTVLIFDENARREFLTGFHKRKLQRKAKAAEELQQQLKIERKKLQMQTKIAYQKLIQSQKPVPEIEHLLTEKIDIDTHSVTVIQLSAEVLAQKNNCIGVNKVEYQNEVDKDSTKENHETPHNKVIEGMEIKNDSQKGGMQKKIKTQKDLKKSIKREATQLIQKNKVFKKRSRVAQIKDMKHKRREERRKRKLSKKRKGCKLQS